MILRKRSKKLVLKWEGGQGRRKERVVLMGLHNAQRVGRISGSFSCQLSSLLASNFGLRRHRWGVLLKEEA